MNKLENIKKKLISHKEILEEAMTRVYKEKVSDDQVQDIGDQAIATTLEELKISLHNNELDEYNMVLKALERLNTGNYGLCIECDKPIPERRLLMFPNTTRCLICQEAAEDERL